MSSATSSALRSRIISMYREMYRHIQNLPKEKQTTMLEQLRQEFRANKDVTDSNMIEKLVAKAESKLGYLRIIAPRRGRTYGVSNRWVLRDGELQEGAAVRPRAGFIDPRPDPDDIARHQRLLRRQHFLDRDKPLRITPGGEGKVLPWSD